MLPGEYLFNTVDAEVRAILSRELEVLLAGAENWQAVKGGESFEVPANSSFNVNIKTATDYCCWFIK